MGPAHHNWSIDSIGRVCLSALSRAAVRAQNIGAAGKAAARSARGPGSRNGQTYETTKASGSDSDAPLVCVSDLHGGGGSAVGRCCSLRPPSQFPREVFYRVEVYPHQ